MRSTETETIQEVELTNARSVPAPSPRRFRIGWLLLTVVVAAIAWAAFDRYGPASSNLRRFDPDEVARLETAMWRSYYNRERVKLFQELAELMRTQYNMPFVRSNAVAYQAARAAIVF
jgi:hypothetical protein